MGYKAPEHQISPNNLNWDYCVKTCTDSTALFNLANDMQWTSWSYGHGLISQAKFDVMLKQSPEYKALPAKVSQLVLKQVSDGWVNWLKQLADWKINPDKYKGKPKPPKHKFGLNLVTFNCQAVSKKAWKKGFVKPSMSPLSVSCPPNVNFESLSEVRLVPKTGCFGLQIVYDDGLEDWRLDHKGLGASIDINLDNLALITLSNPAITPIAISGKTLKSINQWANKQNAKYRSLLNSSQETSKNIDAIWRKHNNQVSNYLHHAAKRIVDELDDIGVTCVAIGKNKGWKDNINIGKKNNQQFVCVPFARFIDLLQRKLEAVGITVKIGEESYTSKASFLDWDDIPTYQSGNTEKHLFSGKRVTTKCYRSKNGSLINADVNGSFNIGRKVIPEYFGSDLKNILDQDSGCVVAHPRRVDPLKTTKKKNINGSVYV